jgi:hypothetical protein
MLDIATATVSGWHIAFYVGLGFALLSAAAAAFIVKQHKHHLAAHAPATAMH